MRSSLSLFKSFFAFLAAGLVDVCRRQQQWHLGPRRAASTTVQSTPIGGVSHRQCHRQSLHFFWCQWPQLGFEWRISSGHTYVLRAPVGFKSRVVVDHQRRWTTTFGKNANCQLLVKIFQIQPKGLFYLLTSSTSNLKSSMSSKLR